MAEEGTLPSDVAARIRHKLIEKFEVAQTLQMHNDSSDYWDNALRYPLGFQCATLVLRCRCPFHACTDSTVSARSTFLE
jgi:hypothetical protein